jgi:hypothetical protein
MLLLRPTYRNDLAATGSKAVMQRDSLSGFDRSQLDPKGFLDELR